MPAGAEIATQAPDELAQVWMLCRSLLNATQTAAEISSSSSPDSHLNLAHFLLHIFLFYPGYHSAHLFFIGDPALGVIFVCLWTLCITPGPMAAWPTTEPTAKPSAVSSAEFQGTSSSYTHALPVVI